ncbi:MAG: FkbM family methyltransferase [Proteobacteria bacterium]|nr:FkbM family methyltransferase [Pseudomonadota bacterium]
MIKRLAKQGLHNAVRRLSWGAREAAFDALVQRMGEEEAFCRLAARIGISGVIANGAYGFFESASNDRVILPTYARTGRWARRTNDFFIEFFRGTDAGTYLDIGANIGLATVPIGKLSTVRCIAFEAEPINFSHLKANVQRNGVSDCTELYQIALSDRSGQIDFGLAGDGNLGDHRIVSSPGERATVRVPTARLDDLVGDIRAPLGVKIDTQGAEPLILAGGPRTLGLANALVMEFCPAMMAALSGNVESIFGFLEGFDRIAIAAGEADSPLDFQTPSEAVMFLRALNKRAQNDPRDYVDVFGLR